MQKIGFIFATFCLSLSLAACDEGAIDEASCSLLTSGEGGGSRTFKLTVNIVGADTWPSQYSVVLACFGADDQAVSQKSLPEGATGVITELLTLPDSVSVQRVELCVTNRLRRRVMTYASAVVPEGVADTLRLDAGTVNLSMYDYLQLSIFTPLCATCHRQGSSTGLELADGLSYANLVNHAANNAANGVRVAPRKVNASLLYRVLSGDETPGVPYDHSQMLRADQLELIAGWIKGGSEE